MLGFLSLPESLVVYLDIYLLFYLMLLKDFINQYEKKFKEKDIGSCSRDIYYIIEECLNIKKNDSIFLKELTINLEQRRKLESLFYDIYYFPINTLRFLKKQRQKRTYLKGCTEIEVLREEIDKIDNIKRIGGNNG